MSIHDEINTQYFEWIRRIAIDGRLKNRPYTMLLRRLHETPFRVILPMDENRAEDGIDLRYRFGCECGYEQSVTTIYLDNRPCSVLEMMVALAIRCEEHIMDDPDIGNRTGQWFWGMIGNLRLDTMLDARFDPDYVDVVLERFLNREYEPTGEGGLFTVEDCRHDLRTVEIWYQMCWYLDDVLQI